MKRIILFIILSLFLIMPVYAQENKLYFVEGDEGLYYESSLINENVFMKHLDMVPDQEYSDSLFIENGADDRYLLFFKIEDVQSELLDNIIMRIYLDGELIYNGLATGVDYYGDGINLRDIVCLGYVEPGREYEMRVTTKLSRNYTTPGTVDTSTIDWAFYAQYPAVDEPVPLPTPHPIDPEDPPEPDDPDEPDNPVDPGHDNPTDNPNIVEIVPMPNTGIDKNFEGSYITAIALFGLSFSIIMYLIFNNREEEV